MTPQDLIYLAVGCPPCPDAVEAYGQCAFCGIAPGAVPVKNVFGDGFTNWDRMRSPNSSQVCLACWTCFRSEHARKLRTSAWVASKNGILYLKRGHVACALFAEKETPFVFYVTTSFKKIGVAKVQLNYSAERFVVQFEEIPTTVEPAIHGPLFVQMSAFYSVPACDAKKFEAYQAAQATPAEGGDEEEKKKSPPSAFFTKEEIRTGEYQPHRIREYGIEEWRAAEEKFREYRGQPIFELLVFSLNLSLSTRDRKVEASEKKGKRAERIGRAEHVCSRPRQVSAGSIPALPGLAGNRMGQGLFWPEDENL
jgi:hypothetical protein